MHFILHAYHVGLCFCKALHGLRTGSHQSSSPLIAETDPWAAGKAGKGEEGRTRGSSNCFRLQLHHPWHTLHGPLTGPPQLLHPQEDPRGPCLAEAPGHPLWWAFSCSQASDIVLKCWFISSSVMTLADRCMWQAVQALQCETHSWACLHQQPFPFEQNSCLLFH